jgi:hypothetical protein
MAKPRPTEIRLVAKLLDPDNASEGQAEDLALEIIEALDSARLKRESYTVVAKLADWAPLQAWGEFSTKLQAEKFLGNLSAADGTGKGAITKLEDPDNYKKRMGE